MRRAVLIAALAAGCAGGGSGADAAGGPVTFVFENATARTVYLPGGDDWWTLLRGAELVRARDRCEICNCSEQGCAVCGQAIPSVTAVPAGGRTEVVWAAEEWIERSGVKATGTCEEATAAKRGTLTFQARYGFTMGPAAIGIGTEIKDATLLEDRFALPGTSRVTVTAR